MDNQFIIYLLIGLVILLLVIVIIMLVRLSIVNNNNEHVQKRLIDNNNQNQQMINSLLEQKLTLIGKNLNESLFSMQSTLNNSALQNEQKLENIRTTLEYRILNLQNENSKKLDEMRNTVDEKLQKTLEERITKSFSLVNERLDQVSKGLGEMSTLASGVGDLKKVLSNVKTRGILGETQLKAILSEVLAPNQYLENVPTIKGSTNRVEFAIKLPNDDKEPVLLPIDSKFPLEDYQRLMDAYEVSDLALIEEYSKKIENNIKKSAKDIRDKYIKVPETTEFGILFLPIEGLYAEAVRRGLIEILQSEYRITLAGPTTMAALLNSLQMGFRTLAIQQRSSEVWKILATVKDEFNNFAGVLNKHQERLNQANEELDKLVGIRTRKLVNTLNKIDIIEEENRKQIGEDDEI